jgi:phenylpropionate dioxygenase-like ring-hydroxylating dioxygenase large terminal subunit
MTIHADAGVPSVFVKFHALEQTRFTTMTSAAEELETGKLTRDQYFARLEQEVFEPYRKLQEEMRATREVPERLRTLLALDGELVVAHLAAWEASKAAAAAQDPEKLKTLLDAEKRAYDKVAKRSEGVTVETNRLKP